MQIHHSLPPLRIDVAIVLLLATLILLGLAVLRMKRASRPHHSRINIVRPTSSDTTDAAP